jgi:hypothetical protein
VIQERKNSGGECIVVTVSPAFRLVLPFKCLLAFHVLLSFSFCEVYQAFISSSSIGKEVFW